MRTPVTVAFLAAALAACDSAEPPKAAVVTEQVRPAALEPKPAPAPAPVAAPQPSPDQLLAERVKRALRDAREVPGQGVDATVEGGVVTLYGTVPSRDDRGKVGDFVAGIGGVRSVVNKLVVVRGS
jgi:osmotically-inducible protein OsmY